MASFMGGSGRITVMLATVILELTADAGLIAPVGITCVIAMLVGNLFNHGTFKIEKLKCSRLCHYTRIVIIVKIIFISSFLF